MAATTPPGDPRAAAASGGSGGNGNAPAAGASASALPVVARAARGPSMAIAIVVLIVFGIALFLVLDARRRSGSAPAVRAGGSDRAALPGSAAPPSLFIPPDPAPPPVVQQAPAEAPVQLPPPPAPQPQIVYVPQPAPPPAPSAPVEIGAARAASDPALVYDSSAAEQAAGGAASGGEGSGSGGGTAAGQSNGVQSVAGARARAGVLANRSNTVAQGTLIPAVLETGIDSTRPGLARAMVTRDVRGFDGKRILIPRGSRLIGEYASQNQLGQKRALVNWVRLIRPDGVTIAIGSPAGDPLGRGGVRAKVDSHFFERFTGAILQSALDVGVNLASRSSNSPVVVALPGAVQNSTAPLVQQQQIQPTLKVAPGVSITIFVARDLDFSGAEGRR
ncbi:TrbI/VirB10 family protein [Sphingomonas canadensis]|uniref:TrbI/VirB10 family protein n=1 Tax=Sphingomonas canadensis TaxID=1219257 RepID=A0ABW3HB68_9SPHN|nr:TrbI/VirB10 family protein [Sphingomonas canadensis]MCW3838425.1 TrbI/VirB10 family protein [Sphingomonas canadensis]